MSDASPSAVQSSGRRRSSQRHETESNTTVSENDYMDINAIPIDDASPQRAGDNKAHSSSPAARAPSNKSTPRKPAQPRGKQAVAAPSARSKQFQDKKMILSPAAASGFGTSTSSTLNSSSTGAAQYGLVQAMNLRQALHLPSIHEKPTSVTARLPHASSSSPPAAVAAATSRGASNGSHHQHHHGHHRSQSKNRKSNDKTRPGSVDEFLDTTLREKLDPVQQQLIEMPFSVGDTTDGIAHLPPEAWMPRENPAEEHRRLQLLELYWNNNNPHLPGMFSTFEPIDRLASRFQYPGGVDGSAAGLPPGVDPVQGKLIATLKQSVLLNQIPRSSLQQRIDTTLDRRAERKRQRALRRAAKRALQQDTDSDAEENGGKKKTRNDDDDNDSEAAAAARARSRERREQERQQREEEQEKRREALRKRFFDGDVFDEHDPNWRRAECRPLEKEVDVGLLARRRRAQETKDRVACEAKAMREAAEARRLAAMKRRADDEHARKRRLDEEKSHRVGETEAERARREELAQKRRDRQAAQQAELERLRKVKMDEEAKKAEKSDKLRRAARERAEEQERERQEKMRAKREAEEARRKKEEEQEAEAALQKKKSFTSTEPEYKYAGPDREKVPIETRKIYECFEKGQGMLYRVVQTDPAIKGKRWHFYNDTDKTTFLIKIFFEPPCSVRPIGEATLLENECENGQVVIAIKVPPMATLAFHEGQVKQFSAEIEGEDEASSPEGSEMRHDGSSSFMEGDQSGQLPISPKYKNGAPQHVEAPYEVYEEGEGMLYRIVKRFPETNTEQWWYYNDDDSFGIKIKVNFGPKSEIEPLGASKMRKLETNGQFEVLSQVECMQTIPFIRGKVSGFVQAFDIVEPEYKSPSPVRKVDRRKSMSGAERRNFIKELQKRATDLVEQFTRFATTPKPDGGGITEMDMANIASWTMQQQQDLLFTALKKKHFFIDLQFPPTIMSVSTDEEQQGDLSELCWVKAEDYVPQSAPTKKAMPIVGNTVSASDITAGAISDWWILSALGVLAQTPFRIVQLFKNHPMGPAVEKHEISQGIYRVRMLVGGLWTDVIVDDWMPVEVDAHGQTSLFFAHSAKGPHELWVSLIEKALAKTSADHCFTELGNGDSLHIIEDLTGFPCVRLDPRLHPDDDEDEEVSDPEESGAGSRRASQSEGEGNLDLELSGSINAEEKSLFNDFKVYLERGWLVMLNTAQAPDDDDELETQKEMLSSAGLEVDCTYKVMDVKDFEYHGKTYRLVRIANPWGKGTEWKGTWGWGHTEWRRIPCAWKTCHSDPPAMPSFSAIGGDGFPGIGISVGDAHTIPVPAAAVAVSGSKSGKAAAAAATSSAAAKKPQGVGKSPDDSTFWMEWKDVKKHFAGAGVCYLQNDWHDYRVPGKFVDGHPSIGLEVRCTQRTRAFLLLVQPAGIGFDEAHPDARYAGALLSVASRRPDEGDFEIKRNSDLYFDKPSRELTFVVGRSLGTEYTFEPSDDDVHLIVPRCFSKTANKDYVLVVILDQPVGEDVISFRFKHFKPELQIFEGFPTFSYSRSQHTVEIDDAPFQYKPPQGRPQMNIGNELQGAPSDLIAARGGSRLGATSSLSMSPSGKTDGGAAASAPGNSLLAGSNSGNMMGGIAHSMSFDVLTDVLLHIRNSSELPFEVNSIAAYDFRGIEVFRATKTLQPATRTPSWATVDKEANAPLGYVWNDEHRNLTFRLLYVDPATGDATTMAEGKSTWDDATVAAKLPNDAGTNRRPVVALRLRAPAASRNAASLNNVITNSSSSSKDVVGTLSVTFSAVSRTTQLNDANYFTIVISGASSFKKAGSMSDVAATHVVMHSGKNKSSEALFVSGDSMAAKPGEVMFMGHSALCVLHNNGHGFLLHVTDAADDTVVFAEHLFSLQQLVELTGKGEQKIDLTAGAAAGDMGDKKPWLKCTIQAFHNDN